MFCLAIHLQLHVFNLDWFGRWGHTIFENEFCLFIFSFYFCSCYFCSFVLLFFCLLFLSFLDCPARRVFNVAVCYCIFICIFYVNVLFPLYNIWRRKKKPSDENWPIEHSRYLTSLSGSFSPQKEFPRFVGSFYLINHTFLFSFSLTSYVASLNY